MNNITDREIGILLKALEGFRHAEEQGRQMAFQAGLMACSTKSQAELLTSAYNQEKRMSIEREELLSEDVDIIKSKLIRFKRNRKRGDIITKSHNVVEQGGESGKDNPNKSL